MSDRLELLQSQARNRGNTLADMRRFKETAARLRTGLTPSQRELQQFIPGAQEDDEKERTRIRPLAFILNLLQTGQFVTANIWQEVKDSQRSGSALSNEAQDEIKGVWQGVVAGLQAGFSGGQKGRALSFEDVFFENIKKEDRNFGHKVVGFFADVLLDPTTYLTFGAGGAVRGVAAKFAMDSAKVAIKEAAPDLLAKFGKNAFKEGADVESILKGLAGGPKKYVQDAYNRAYREAITSPGGRGGAEFEELLQGSLQKRLNDLPGRQFDIIDPAVRSVDEVGGIAPSKLAGQPGIEAGREGLTATKGGFADESLNTLQKSITEGYAGVGQRQARVVGIKVPGELGRILDSPMRAGRDVFEMARARFGETGTGRLFGNAWFAVLNGGPVDGFRALLGKSPKGFGMVGALRESFGFLRTPFEQVRHAALREHDSLVQSQIRRTHLAIDQLFDGLSDDQNKKLRRVLFEADNIARKKEAGEAAVESAADLNIDPQDLMDRFGHDPQSKEVLGRLKELMDAFFADESQVAAEGIVQEFGKIMNNFPIHFSDNVLPSGTQINLQKAGGDIGQATGQAPGPIGTKTPGTTKAQPIGPTEQLKTNKEHLKWAIGDRLKETAEKRGMSTDELLEDLIENKGWGDFEINVKEAFKIRASAHARIMGRYKMVKQFREFGIPIAEIEDGLRKAGSLDPRDAFGNIPGLGLKRVGDDSLSGYLFDSDMADIIGRAYDITETGAGSNMFKRGFAWYTRFWKTFATATPRFHIRNAVSNETTLFLKHGLRAFDVRVKVDAMVATTYALHPDRYMDLLKGHLNKSEAWITRRLNKRVGNGAKSLREVADEAESLGAIVPRGSFSREIGPTEGGRASFFDKGPFKLNKALGDAIENTTRMNSYLLDYTAGMGFRGNAEYAAREARKWFLDYDDLTPDEKNIWRNIIPFYTWMRKNLANQISRLTLHGNLYSIIPKAQRLAQAGVGASGEIVSNLLGVRTPGQAGASIHDGDVDYQLLDDWEQNLGLFPVWQDRDTKKTLMFDPFFSYQNLNLIPIFWEDGNFLPSFNFREGLNEIMSAAHPIIKTGAELAFGQNVFKQKDIPEQEIASKPFQLLSEKPGIVAFIDGLMRLGGQEEGAKMTIEDGTLKIDGQVERLLDNNLPMLRTIGSVIESAEAVNEVIFQKGLQDTLEQINSERDYNKAFSKMLRATGFWLGAKLREFDVKDREEKEAERVRAEAERRRRDMRRGLPGAEQRSSERSRQRVQENQRLGLL
jgi:hypothetical protein